jgi:uncharacterized membrane protein YgcG
MKPSFSYFTVFLVFGGMLLFGAPVFAQTTNGLVGYWALDEGSGSIVADSAGNNDGIINGAQWAGVSDCQEGTCLLFDGMDDYIEFEGYNSESWGGFTAATWFKIDDLSNCLNNYCPIIFKDNGTAFDDQWFVHVLQVEQQKRLRFELTTTIQLSSKTVAIYGNHSDIVEGRWYHVAATFDGAIMRLYLDGVLVGSADMVASAGIEPYSGNPLEQVFDGWMDELRIYNRSLSQSEIAGLMGESVCGDGVKDADEECDGNDFGIYGNGVGQCDEYNSDLFSGGNLTCVSCFIQTDQCDGIAGGPPILDVLAPNQVELGSGESFVLTGNNFESNIQIKIGNLSHFDGTFVDSTQAAFSLTSTQIDTLGIGSHSVRARNGDQGTVSNSLILNVAEESPDGSPTNLVAAVSGADEITLTWDDNVTNETGYAVERSLDNYTFEEIAGSLATDTVTYADSGLTNGTYYYRVRAFNNGGYSEYSNTDSGTISSGDGEEPDPDVLLLTFQNGTVNDSMEYDSIAQAIFDINKLKSAEEGYDHAASLIVMTLCRLNHEDTEKANLCNDTKSYAGLITVLYTDESIYKEVFLQRNSLNFNSIYPVPLYSNDMNADAFLSEGISGVSYSIDPTGTSLDPGQYRVMATLGPADYEFDPNGDGIENKIETETTNNFAYFDFTIESPPDDGDDGGDNGGDNGGNGDGGGNGNGGGGGSGGGSGGDNDNGDSGDSDNGDDGWNDSGDSDALAGALPINVADLIPGDNVTPEEKIVFNFLGFNIVATNPVLFLLFLLLQLLGLV